MLQPMVLKSYEKSTKINVFIDFERLNQLTSMTGKQTINQAKQELVKQQKLHKN